MSGVALPLLFLHRFVHFRRSVNEKRRFEREKKQSHNGAEQTPDRQPIQNKSCQQRDEQRLSRLFSHELLRLRHDFGELILRVMDAALCNIGVLVHNFVSVLRAAPRVFFHHRRVSHTVLAAPAGGNSTGGGSR